MTSQPASRIEIIRKNTYAGFNVDGRPVGHAARIKKDGRWSTYANIDAPPFDVFIGAHASVDAAAEATQRFLDQQKGI